MKDLREYLGEGIFDTDTRSIEGNEDYEKIMLTDIVFELLGGNNNHWKFSKESIMKAIDGNAIYSGSYLNSSNKFLSMSYDYRDNYGIPGVLNIGKYEIDVLRKHNIISLSHGGSNGCIRLLDELDGVDCGGIRLTSAHMAVMPSFKIVNLKIYLHDNPEGMTLYDNKFKNVSIKIMTNNHKRTGYREFDGGRIPKLCIIQFNPSGNVFDDVNLGIITNCNLSIGSTIAGKMIGKLVDEIDKEHGSSDWKANPLSSAEKSKIRKGIKKILNTDDISHISGIAYEYMKTGKPKGGCRVLELKDFYHHDESYYSSNSYDYEYATKNRTPVFMNYDYR